MYLTMGVSLVFYALFPLAYFILRKYGKRSFGKWPLIEFVKTYFTVVVFNMILHVVATSAVLYGGNLKCTYLYFFHKKYMSHKDGVCFGE